METPATTFGILCLFVANLIGKSSRHARNLRYSQTVNSVSELCFLCDEKIPAALARRSAQIDELLQLESSAGSRL